MQLIEKYLPMLTNVTQKAALCAAKWCGLGDEKQADRAAVDAMRSALSEINFAASIVIGEGERDEAPMLYIGENLGTGTDAFDLAVDPLECTTLCANNMPGSLAVLAIANRGDLLHAPDLYMQKIAAPSVVPADAISLNNSCTQNLDNIVNALNIKPQDIMVTVLKRPRHEEMIKQIRTFGAKVKLITDGDVGAVIDVAQNSGPYLNIYMGIGGAPEGVLAAAALKTLGGTMQTQLIFNDDDALTRAQKMGISDSTKIYSIDDMVKGDAAFIATGVTDGNLLRGITRSDRGITSESIVLCSWSRSMQKITHTQIL